MTVQETSARLKANGNISTARYPCDLHEAIRIQRILQKGTSNQQQLFSRRLISFKIDEFVDFPIEGLDMEERCDERRVAKTLVAQGKDLKEYGIDGNLEPLVYDLCESIQDTRSTLADICFRCRRQPLRRHGWRALHGNMQEYAGQQVVQV
jgi:hypothetical protein